MLLPGCDCRFATRMKKQRHVLDSLIWRCIYLHFVISRPRDAQITFSCIYIGGVRGRATLKSECERRRRSPVPPRVKAFDLFTVSSDLSANERLKCWLPTGRPCVAIRRVYILFSSVSQCNFLPLLHLLQANLRKKKPLMMYFLHCGWHLLFFSVYI